MASFLTITVSEPSIIDAQTGEVLMHFDAVLSEGHTTKMEITSFPIGGSHYVTDHFSLSPRVIRLVGGVSPVSVVTIPYYLPAEPSRPKSAYETLLAMQEKGTLVDIKTKLKTYKNYLLKSISVEQDATTGETAKFECEFQEVLISRVEATTVVPQNTPGDVLPAPNNQGGKAVEPLSDTTQPSLKDMKSTLYKVFN